MFWEKLGEPSKSRWIELPILYGKHRRSFLYLPGLHMHIVWLSSNPWSSSHPAQTPLTQRRQPG